MRPGRLIIRGHRFTAADLALFVEAWLTLAASALKLKLLPFERTMRDLPADYPAVPGASELKRLVWAINAARRRSWLRAMCIESALALRSMLRRRGVATTLHYGVRRGDERLEAHVWLSVDGTILIGGETAGQFAEVATFRPSASS